MSEGILVNTMNCDPNGKPCYQINCQNCDHPLARWSRKEDVKRIREVLVANERRDSQ